MSTINPFDSPEDAFNPYTPPRAPVGRPEWAHQAAGASSLPFGAGAVFGRAWEIYKANGGLCVGVFLGCFVMNIAAQNLPQFLVGLVGGVSGAMVAGPGRGPGPNPFVAAGNPAQTQIMLTLLVVLVVLGLAALVFQLWIGIGQTLVYLKVAQGRDASFADVFRGGRFLLRYTLATIVVTIILAIGSLVGAIPAAVVAATGSVDDQAILASIFAIGLLVAVGVMSVVFLRYSQYYFLILDRDAGTMESIRGSLAITRGKVGGLALLGLFAFLVNLGGLLACVVGLAVTMPFTFLMAAVAYQSLVGGPVADPAGLGKPYVPGDPLFDR